MPGIAPNVQAAWNLLGMEDMSHALVHLAADIMDAGRESVVVTAVQIEVAGLMHIRHVVGRQIEIAILVVIAGEKARRLKGASHGENVCKDAWMAEGQIDCMITTKAATDSRQARRAVAVADKRSDFLKEVVFVAKLADEAGPRDNSVVVPAFRINGVDTKELQMTGFKFVGNRLDHASVFKVKKTPARSRKGESGQAGMAEDKQFHLPVKGGRIPFVIFAIHSVRFYCSQRNERSFEGGSPPSIAKSCIFSHT